MSGLSFWEVHGVLGGLFLCVMCALLPRLTLFFLSMITGVIGITFWGFVGGALVPRIVVAIRPVPHYPFRAIMNA